MATKTARILLISDTHSGFINVDNPSSPHFASDEYSFRPPFPQADILIHSGDLTMYGRPGEYRQALDMLASIPAELKLVIAGNHDLSLHRDFYLNERSEHSDQPQAQALDHDHYDPANVDDAENLWHGEAARKAGVTYLTEGLHRFRLANGITFQVYASPWQPEFYNWAFNYPHHEDRWNPPHLVSSAPSAMSRRLPPTVPAPPERDPHPIPENTDIDIVMTHGPPYKHLDRTSGGHDAGCPHLLAALDRVRPRLACFGHIHEGWGADRVVWKQRQDASPTATSTTSGINTGPVGEVTEALGRYRNKAVAEMLDRLRAQAGASSAGETVQSPLQSEVIERHVAFVDISENSARPLQFGEETIMVNSSIMDLQYQARGAAWLVQMELPIGDR